MSDIKAYIAQKAESIVNGARRGSYGKPENNFQRISTMWEAYFRIKGWELVMADTCGGDDPEFVTLEPLDIAAMMRLMKEARLAETPAHLDSFLDIVGYALCGAEVTGIPVPNEEPATRDELLALKNKFVDLLAEKDAEIKKLNTQIDVLVNAPTVLTNASTDPAAALSQAQQKEPATAVRTSP